MRMCTQGVKDVNQEMTAVREQPCEALLQMQRRQYWPDLRRPFLGLPARAFSSKQVSINLRLRR